jgi:hypothetical protein
MLRTGPRRDEIIGGRRKLHNEELHNLYSSPNIITMIKSRSIRLVGHVVLMGGEAIPTEYCVKTKTKETTRI